MDITPMTPVAEGDPPKAGGPTGLVPGGAGAARGDILRKAVRRTFPLEREWPS